MGKFMITFMLVVLLIVFMKASESKPTLKQNILKSSKARGLALGIGNGNGICNDHDQCPDGYACLLAEGKTVKKCVQCNCSETSQCYLESETTFCNCSGTGFTGQYCETLLPPCPMGWYQNRNSCYIYDCTAYDWMAAVWHCQSLSPNEYPNSYLVEITDEEENQVAFAISGITGYSDAWIGLSDTESEGIFKWINSGNIVTYKPFDYIYDAYYPYIYPVEVMDCVHLHYDHWDAEICGKFKPVVCEMPALIQ
ncbi:alpha-N-acetylgalactosamine-specific lectin-like [Ruditapes philippinarum]|uniref:alpha-N-acetylgalactosamine-specific lectin-like n=1 Tax=Ruditapes philippinarum TaxID=129788 RepID=UPI00295B7DA4|nr:alpha-N-acetylgalactosamine-specific lectin-like [Ruditapes philippinarum]XP_060556524.1 alpha-N-acetylgalactosamine-specific lectin-like [Ruditapes philippinarum]